MNSSDSRPLVSVVIPAHNSAAFIERALRSVTAQTWRPLEIIVVDDGSTDNTRSVVERFNGPVRYHYQENAGPSAARNRGVRESRGEFVAFLDSDDEWLPERLEKTIGLLVADPKASLAYCRSKRVFPDGSWLLESAGESGEGRRNAVRALPSCATPAVAIRRSILDKVGLFDTEMKYFEDVDLFLRVAEEGAVARSQEALVLIHDRPDSLSHAAALTPERSAHAADMVFRLTFKALLRNKTPRDRDGALSAAYQSAGIYAFERGDMRLARRYFRIALLLEFSRQGLVLYLRSWTPRWINALARRLKNRRLVRK